MAVKEVLQRKLLDTILSWHARPSAVRSVFRHASRAAATPAAVTTTVVRVAAIQAEAKLFRNPRRFAEEMRRLASVAAARGAKIVAYPEDVGSFLLGLIPGIGRMAASSSSGKELPVSIADVFALLARASVPIYYETFSGVAREFGMYVFAGSLPVRGADGSVTNRAHVFAPDGRLLGSQDKVHLFPSPVEDGFRPGKSLDPIELPWCRAAVPVCMDATYFETFRIAGRLGAELVVIPIANPEDYDFWYALRGIWPRIQENRMYGIKSALVGELLGYRLTGVSGIYGPIDLTPEGDGILAEAGSCDQEEIVVADLDFAMLRRYAAEHPLDLRTDVYARYLPDLYEKSARCPSAP